MDAMPAPILELVDILHQEIAHLHELAHVATEERAALNRLAMPAFDTVNHRRVQMLELLHVLESRREAILDGLARDWGVAAGSLTLASVMDRVGRDVSRTLYGQQQELDRMVDAVRQLMAVNRLAMSKLVDFIQQTLAAAHPGSGGAILYSESGAQKTSPTSGRVVVQRG